MSTSITNSFVPPEWNNDERMRVLMGSMPQPHETISYNSRIVFWSTNLHKWIQEKDGLSFSLQEFQLAFRRGTQTAQCLDQVLQHLLRQGDILTLEDLRAKSKLSESWTSWSKQVLIASPSRWAWRKVKDTIGGSSFLESTVFIDWLVVQEVGDKILSEYWSKHDSLHRKEDVLNVQEFFKVSKSIIHNILLDDINIILQYLSMNKKVCIKVHQEETYVKLCRPGTFKELIIEDSEIAERQLENTETILQERITYLEDEIQPLKDQIKLLLRNGSKKQALTLLRRKKNLEASLDKMVSSRENVSSCLRQLQDSHINKEILGTFQLGLQALKSSLSETGNTDDVSETMETLQDILEDCNEVTDIISKGGQSPTNCEEDKALEQELEDLLHLSIKDETSYIDLPAVPTNDPLTPAKGVQEEGHILSP